MVQRQKRLTKREKKATSPERAHSHEHRHIHCIACGKHLDPEAFEASPPGALYLNCQHGSAFPSCASCEVESKFRLAEHDRTGQAVKMAQAWH